MAKVVEFAPEVTKKLKAGVDKLERAVGATIGPRGFFAIFQEEGRPVVTNDGVTVAKNFSLPDPMENMAVNLVRQASVETNRSVGDGTTSAVILTKALLDKGWKLIKEDGIHPFEVKLAFDVCRDKISQMLPQMARPAQDLDSLVSVATLAANGDKSIGEAVGELAVVVGHRGTIIIDINELPQIDTELIEGYSFDSGVVSPYFLAGQTVAQLDNVPVLLYDGRITSGQDMLKALEVLDKAGIKKLVLVARELSGPALELLARNKKDGLFDVIPVFAPGFSKSSAAGFMEDLAVLTGAKVVAQDRGVNITDISPDDLGKVGRVLATQRQTQFLNIPVTEEVIEAHIKHLKEGRKHLDVSDRTILDHRIDRLGRKTGVVKVGATSEFAGEEALFRVDDAVHAAQAAHEAGTVPGGGVTLAILADIDWRDKFSEFPDDGVKTAVLETMKCLRAPFDRIVTNAVGDPGKLWALLKNKEIRDAKVWDAANNLIVEPYKAGIIDPVKVVQTALVKAFDVAGNILATTTVITDDGKPTQ